MQTIYLGAIDIGSNAARLLIASINIGEPQPKLRKTILLRVPLRLGEDVFTNGKISDARTKKFIRLMKAYKQLLSIYEVKRYRICATSAMREALNGQAVADKIRKKTGMMIEIISGKDEARIIYESKITDELNPDKAYMYVDVGGGSTEITVIENHRKTHSKSFRIGTLRLLANKVSPDEWTSMSEWLETMRDKASNMEIVGLGGNINKLYRLANLPKGQPLTPQNLQSIYSELKVLTPDERMVKYDMKPDRADVIVPASEIFLFVCSKANIPAINVPTIGLADGIVHALYEEHRN